MTVKLLLFKSGETVISDVKEIVSLDKVCGYLLDKPHKVTTRKPFVLTEDENKELRSIELEVVLTPWIILTNDKEIAIPKDWVVTLVEPLSSVKNVYFEKLNAYPDQTESIEEEVTLNE